MVMNNIFRMKLFGIIFVAITVYCFFNVYKSISNVFIFILIIKKITDAYLKDTFS